MQVHLILLGDWLFMGTIFRKCLIWVASKTWQCAIKKGAITCFSTLKRRFYWYPTSISGTGRQHSRYRLEVSPWVKVPLWMVCTIQGTGPWMLFSISAIILQTVFISEDVDSTDVILEALQVDLYYRLSSGAQSLMRSVFLSSALLREAFTKLIASINTLFLWLCKPWRDS